MRGQLHELIGSQSSPGEARLSNRSFEIVDFVDPHAHRRMTRTFRLEVDRGFPLQLTVDEASELLPIVDHRDMMPHIQRVQEIAIHQRFVGSGRVDESIQTPLVANDADFKKKTGIRVSSGLGILFGQMKPALLGFSAALRTENGLKGKRFRAGEGMLGDEDSIVNSVELDGLPQRRLYNARMAKHRRCQAADFVDMIEYPNFRMAGTGWARRRGQQSYRSKNNAGQYSAV